jgi:hypothetical protein
MNDKRLHLKDIRFAYSFNENNLVDIKLYVKGYDETVHGSLLFLALDTLLGEYDVMTRIGRIEFKELSDADSTNLKTLPELVKLVDSRKN